MKKLLAVIIILLVAILMALTKPSEQKHKDVMMTAIKEFVDQEAEDRGFKNNGLTRLGKNAVTQAIKTALNTKLKFNDYYLVNTSYVRLKGENQLLSLGIFGQVITFDKDMLHEKLQEAIKTKEVEAVQKAAAKAEAKDLKRQLKQQKKREKQLAKEQRKREKAAEKEARRKAKEAEKEAKRHSNE